MRPFLRFHKIPCEPKIAKRSSHLLVRNACKHLVAENVITKTLALQETLYESISLLIMSFILYLNSLYLNNFFIIK